MDIIFKPIGITHTHGSDAEIRGRGDLEGELEIFPEFADGLDGIDGYSHLFVIAYFDRLRPEQIGPLKVKPRGLLRRGYKLDELPLLGVFALDSPTRPNPIGLTLVRVRKREGNRIIVQGLDFFDRTPILDIKGYRPQYRADEYSLPEWYLKLAGERGDV
ncbi:MAG: tRNA (N6-threonylcarbamoyladenosine(37)-N6)-methyltransferase TrmO [Deltaproteobacteria bacterium]|nr:tRNA (N6-threonylcarbamoyladenosine(37)-N6)-methyltransferase TrmO [Deltaproteobacteria bacterium]MBI2534831.1 tRNA (N6-threonylcarbamoyladenosine(37)-N6)-methyltransferase TrmO [Deltaproteobacteria bacterium]MBI3065645.1 tRNA (N6-threonylcarbamoyladenosine(37)-N6)-methyltransferase TrmO [Deltaproteobacteria bacterium]